MRKGRLTAVPVPARRAGTATVAARRYLLQNFTLLQTTVAGPLPLSVR